MNLANKIFTNFFFTYLKHFSTHKCDENLKYKLIYLTFFLGLIYIVGGCTHNRRHLQDLLSYNPVTGEWTQLAAMLVPRSQMGVAVLDGYLYVVGGINRDHEVLHFTERYNFHEVLFELSIHELYLLPYNPYKYNM